MTNGLIELLLSVVEILEDLGIAYALGGSMASSVFGEPRATMDVDIAVRVGSEQIDPLLSALSKSLYVPDESARAACIDGGSFNVLEVDSGYKVDLFVLSDDLLDRRQIERRISTPLGDLSQNVDVTAPEDQLLRKLEWFRSGGQSSDRQWRDVIGLLEVSADLMDLGDLTRTAESLGLDDLLAAAIRESETG